MGRYINDLQRIVTPADPSPAPATQIDFIVEVALQIVDDIDDIGDNSDVPVVNGTNKLRWISKRNSQLSHASQPAVLSQSTSNGNSSGDSIANGTCNASETRPNIDETDDESVDEEDITWNPLCYQTTINTHSASVETCYPRNCTLPFSESRCVSMALSIYSKTPDGNQAFREGSCSAFTSRIRVPSNRRLFGPSVVETRRRMQFSISGVRVCRAFCMMCYVNKRGSLPRLADVLDGLPVGYTKNEKGDNADELLRKTAARVVDVLVFAAVDGHPDPGRDS